MTDKYNPKYCTEAFKLMSAGLSETRVMANLDISRSTFYRWKKEHPEFKDAVERGAVQFDAQHEELGIKGMLKEIDMEYQFWRDLGKYTHGWTDKSVPGITNNTQINIDQMNVLNEQSNEELLIYIKNKLNELPELSNIIDVELDGSE